MGKSVDSVGHSCLSQSNVADYAHKKNRRPDGRRCFFVSKNSRGAFPSGDWAQKTLQVLAAHGVLQLAHGFGFDLPHAFAGDLENAADFFERVGVAIGQAVAQADDFAFADRSASSASPRSSAAAGRCWPSMHRAFGAGILDELAEAAVFAFADRPIEADRMPADVQHAAASSSVMPAAIAISSVVGSRPNSCSSRLATLRSFDQHVDHVHRNANRAGLIGNRAGNRLANPPRGVRAELEAAAILVLIDGSHQAGVAFLNQVQEAQAAVAVLLGDQTTSRKLPLESWRLTCS